MGLNIYNCVQLRIQVTIHTQRQYSYRHFYLTNQLNPRQAYARNSVDVMCIRLLRNVFRVFAVFVRSDLSVLAEPNNQDNTSDKRN